MARSINRLTAIGVARQEKPGLYSDGGGLYLQITAAGVKSWLLRYMRDGRARGMGLGPLHTISLAEARSKALAYAAELNPFWTGRPFAAIGLARIPHAGRDTWIICCPSDPKCNASNIILHCRTRMLLRSFKCCEANPATLKRLWPSSS